MGTRGCSFLGVRAVSLLIGNSHTGCLVLIGRSRVIYISWSASSSGPRTGCPGWVTPAGSALQQDGRLTAPRPVAKRETPTPISITVSYMLGSSF